MTRILFALILLAASVANASDRVAPRAQRYPYGTVLTNASLAGAAAVRTAHVSLVYATGYDLMTVSVSHTNVTGALTVTMTCYNDTTGSTGTSSILQSCAVSSGTCTSSDAVFSKSVTATKAWPWRVDISGYEGAINCVFAASGAAAGDTISASVGLATK